MESVIDAIAAKQRAGERRTFDDAAKATLRCIMRCYGYFAGCRSLARIALPESLTIIEPYAFAYCTRLKSVTLPESLTSIKTGAFAECINMNNILGVA